MAGLYNKVVKKKKLCKLGTSLVVIIPDNWLKEMNWDRTTILAVMWHALNQEIIIRKIGEEKTEIDDLKNEETN